MTTVNFIYPNNTYTMKLETLKKYDNYFSALSRFPRAIAENGNISVKIEDLNSEDALKYLIDENYNIPIVTSSHLDCYCVYNYNSYCNIFGKEMYIRNNMYNHTFTNHKMNTDPYHNLIKITEDVWDKIVVQSSNSDHYLFEGSVEKKSWSYIEERLIELTYLFENIEDIVVAGGFLFSCLFGNKTGDVDIFFYNQSEEAALNSMRKFKDLHLKQYSSSYDFYVQRSKSAITFNKPKKRYLLEEDECSIYDYQFILRLYKQPHEVIHGFDVDCCSILYDGNNIYCTERFLYSLFHGVNFFNPELMSPSYEYRLAKYGTRGFGIHVDDFDRSRINQENLQERYDLQFNYMGESDMFFIQHKLKTLTGKWYYKDFSCLTGEKHEPIIYVETDYDPFDKEYYVEMIRRKQEGIKELLESLYPEIQRCIKYVKSIIEKSNDDFECSIDHECSRNISSCSYLLLHRNNIEKLNWLYEFFQHMEEGKYSLSGIDKCEFKFGNIYRSKYTYYRSLSGIVNKYRKILKEHERIIDIQNFDYDEMERLREERDKIIEKYSCAEIRVRSNYHNKFDIKRRGLSLLLLLEKRYMETKQKRRFKENIEKLSELKSDYKYSTDTSLQPMRKRDVTGMKHNIQHILGECRYSQPGKLTEDLLKEVEEIAYDYEDFDVPFFPLYSKDIDFINAFSDRDYDRLMNIDEKVVQVYEALGSFSVGATPKFKKINPGEQTTSTFNRLILDDISLWYHDHLTCETFPPIYV